MDISTKYAYHLDELRRRSGIKVNDFCDGICSDRQYRRYISGVYEIPQKSIILFAEKIGLSPSDFYNSFYSHDTEEYQRVASIYDNITELKWEIVYDEINKMKTHKFLSVQSKNLYDYCIINSDFQTKKITKLHSYDLYKDLINYPKCLKKKVFDIVDVITISQIAVIEHEIEKEEAILFLYRILFDREFVYVSSVNKYLLPSVYARLSRILAMKKKFSETEKISTIGIKYSLSIGDIHALPHLYYLKSWVLLKLGKRNLGMLEAKKCLAASIAKDNIREYEMFSKEIKDDFSINPMDLFLPNFIKS